MPRFTSHAPGTFCFVELATADPDAAAAFYTALFGWERRDEDGPPGAYTRYRLGGAVAAAQFRIPDDEFHAGMTPHWGQYVAVADTDAVCARAAGLGGEIVAAPCDLPGHGRLAVLRDRSGAVFSTWQAAGDPGCTVLDEPGALCWSELLTADIAAARAFYAPLFGWGTREMDLGEHGVYTLWTREQERPPGGAITPRGAGPGLRPWWQPYFQVEDVDAVASLAAEHGGRVVVAPVDMPDAGRLAVIADPGGAVCGIYRPRG